MVESNALIESRARFHDLMSDRGLLSARTSVKARALTPEQAIGTPARRDFPIAVGKERLIEAVVEGTKGQAFTDSPREFEGTIADVLELDLGGDSTTHRRADNRANSTRAIYLATLNAALAHLGLVCGTVHCKDDDPEECALEIAKQLRSEHGSARVGLVGLNPAIAERMSSDFGASSVHITDLCPEQIGQVRFGVEVWDGTLRIDELIRRSDVVLVTGTTLQNGSFDAIWTRIQHHRKRGIVFGVTASGICALQGYPRVCPRARQS